MKKNILDEKCLSFAVRIVRFYQYLCKEKKEFVLSKQILRSGTSLAPIFVKAEMHSPMRIS